VDGEWLEVDAGWAGGRLGAESIGLGLITPGTG
jgi:hypothetical protein